MDEDLDLIPLSKYESQKEELNACLVNKESLEKEVQILKDRLNKEVNDRPLTSKLLVAFILSIIYLPLNIDANYELLGDGSKTFYVRRREVDGWVTNGYLLTCIALFLNKEQLENISRVTSGFSNRSNP